MIFSTETTSMELAHHMFPSPTLSEMIHEAVLDSRGKSDSSLSRNPPKGYGFKSAVQPRYR